MVKQSDKTQEMQRRGPSEVAPAYLSELKAGAIGFEQMTAEDQLLPRLQIAQALSPQVQKTKPEYNPDLDQGEFFNSISNKIYGESVVFVPLFFFHSGLNIQDGKVVCMSKDARTCPLYGICKCDTWREGDTIRDRKPECQKLMNYAAYVMGHGDLVVVSLKSTGIKVAKKWNSLQKMLTMVNGRQYPMYTRQYMASAVTETNTAGQQYYQWVFKDAGWVPEEFVQRAGPLVEGLRGKVVVDASGLSGEEKSDEEVPF